MSAGDAHRPPILDYAASPAPSKRGKGFLALCASVLLPGLGQFIAGYRRRGLIWLLVVLSLDTLAFTSLCLPDFVPAIMVLGPIATVAHLSCWLDSYLCGRRSAKDYFRFAVWRYATGLGLLVLGIFLAPQGRVAELLKARVVEAFQTPTASMSPTLIPGDRFLCHKRLAPTRWSIVVINSPLMQSKQVTRLVGLPGETMEIIGGRVHVNGEPVSPPAGVGPYTGTWAGRLPFEGTGCEGNPITLKADEYYFLSDNSPIAADSRHWRIGVRNHQIGTLGRSDIVGVVTWIYWPPSRWIRF